MGDPVDQLERRDRRRQRAAEKAREAEVRDDLRLHPGIADGEQVVARAHREPVRQVRHRFLEQVQDRARPRDSTGRGGPGIRGSQPAEVSMIRPMSIRSARIASGPSSSLRIRWSVRACARQLPALRLDVALETEDANTVGVGADKLLGPSEGRVEVACLEGRFGPVERDPVDPRLMVPGDPVTARPAAGDQGVAGLGHRHERLVARRAEHARRAGGRRAGRGVRTDRRASGSGLLVAVRRADQRLASGSGGPRHPVGPGPRRRSGMTPAAACSALRRAECSWWIATTSAGCPRRRSGPSRAGSPGCSTRSPRSCRGSRGRSPWPP